MEEIARLASKSTPSLPLCFFLDLDSNSLEEETLLVWIRWSTGLIIETLITNSDEMITINRLDIS
jgi:hypothetical protein